MGTIQHHAIIITTWERERAEAFRARAVEIAYGISDFRGEALAGMISPVVLSAANGFATLLIAPDGSKEGWPCSEDGDRFRAALREAFRDEMAGDDWIEVGYGELGLSVKEKIDGA